MQTNESIRRKTHQHIFHQTRCCATRYSPEVFSARSQRSHPGAELFHSANILRVNDTPSPETREKKLFKKLPLQDELLQREGRHHRLRAGREELGHDIRIGREPGRVVSLDLLFSFSEKRFFLFGIGEKFE